MDECPACGRDTLVIENDGDSLEIYCTSCGYDAD